MHLLKSVSTQVMISSTQVRSDYVPKTPHVPSYSVTTVSSVGLEVNKRDPAGKVQTTIGHVGARSDVRGH